MKCPLLPVSSDRHGGLQIVRPQECLKEECAWWIPQGNICAIANLAIDLEDIRHTLENVSDKMPHEEQFRR